MTQEQILLLVILAATVALFAWGRWRHDMVALAALLAATLTGLVPAESAFDGFGHPAVVTVACMLALSYALRQSGLVDLAARRILPAEARPTTMVAGLTALAAALSGFMNNVGALALLMPIALKAAERLDMPPGRLLMPLAFGSILGGMTTLIGTPPNLIVSGYRERLLGAPFGMFDFTPAGLAVAATGVAFIALVGWRLAPARRPPGTEGFDAGAYVTEAQAPSGARAVGLTVREIERATEPADLQVLAIVRRGVRMRAPHPTLRVREGDILMLEADPAGLAAALGELGLKLEEAVKGDRPRERGASDDETAPRPSDDTPPSEMTGADAPRVSAAHGEDDDQLAELVISPDAPLIGRTASGIGIRARYRLNLLAISRSGRRSAARLRNTLFEPGDVLLMQGGHEALSAFAADFGCLPLAERPLHLPARRDMQLAGGIFAGAIALAASGLAPTHVAFAAGLLAAMATRVLPPRSVFRAVDWSVIVLLACLLPVAEAMLSTGAAELIADALVSGVAGGSPLIALVVVLVLTMTLSDVMNNAATVAVMAPIAYGAATTLNASADTFLMAVAIGGSCAFLTPIGHQNNTLILGPGGFRFGDYWRLGLPVEIIVVVVGVPALIQIWGL